MKLELLKLINKVSYNIWKWSVREIDSHVPVKKPRYLYVQDFLILAAVIIFGVLTYFAYAPRNIQDAKPKVKIEKKEKKIIHSPEEKELKRLKKHFKWLTKPVYSYILKRSDIKEVDPIMIMSIKQVETGNHCGNNWKCMVSARGKAGERGAMQIMEYHAKNPKDLDNWKFNTNTGIDYFRGAIEVASGDIRVAVRLYNQGHNGKWQNYKNWKYVSRVMRIYKKAITENVMAVNYEN
jgi:soluble lytic murein transglycosylase-like protein